MPICRQCRTRSVRKSVIPAATTNLLFNYVYDGGVYNADTVMPPWGSHGVVQRPGNGRHLAFLKTFEGTAAVFKTELRRSEQTAGAGENGDNLDLIGKSGQCGRSTGAGALENRWPGPAFPANTCHSDPAAFKTWGGVDAKWERRSARFSVSRSLSRATPALPPARIWPMETEKQTAPCRVYLHTSPMALPITIDATSEETRGGDRARQA